MKITLELHKEKGTNNLLLEHQDVYNFIGENTEKELDLAHYLEKWCDWLNYPLMHTSPVHGDVEEAKLRSWIDGYNYAKHIKEQEFGDRYELDVRGYNIILYKPFVI